jgi:5-hydroxyisourate hydrolase
MAGKVTTHALDTALGRGAGGMTATLERLSPDAFAYPPVALDPGGRATLLTEGLVRGVYALTFDVAAYHRAVGAPVSDPPFLDLVTVRFGVAEPDGHYHVPLLVSPYGYSTYRGG